MTKTQLGQTYLRLVDDRGRPILTSETLSLRDLPAMALNMKFFGYEMARRLAAELPAVDAERPGVLPLRSKATTQADLTSQWAAWWCKQLGVAVTFHRKIWEYVFVLQALHEADMLKSGARGVGFGCGQEPLPSYFAAQGVDVLVTDLDVEKSDRLGWIDSNQHARDAVTAYQPHLVDRETFARRVTHRFVDMNDIPSDLRGHDFCWSICALEHLGSIAKGLDFIENALESVRPGGLSVHTTEFNCLNDGATIDNWPTVLFQRRHFEEIAARLTAKGHHVAPLDFDIGAMPLDQFVDIPPYLHDWTPELIARWGAQANHLKLSIDGFVSTCFGLIVRKAG
jgi:hypothetical protein